MGASQSPGESHLKVAEQCQSRRRRMRTRMQPTDELTELNSEENEERDKVSLLGTGSKNNEFEAQTATTKNSRRLRIFNGELRSRANATAAQRSRQFGSYTHFRILSSIFALNLERWHAQTETRSWPMIMSVPWPTSDSYSTRGITLNGSTFETTPF